MRKIKLTQEKFALVDDKDYEQLNQWKWFAHKYRNTFYAERHLRQKNKRITIKMHYIILKKKKGFVIDHIDRNGLNNQRNNLRYATVLQNNINRGMYKNNKSGVRGVYWHKSVKKWAACIRRNGKSFHLGLFDTPEMAGIVYRRMAKNYFGEFAR